MKNNRGVSSTTISGTNFKITLHTYSHLNSIPRTHYSRFREELPKIFGISCVVWGTPNSDINLYFIYFVYSERIWIFSIVCIFIALELTAKASSKGALKNPNNNQKNKSMLDELINLPESPINTRSNKSFNNAKHIRKNNLSEDTYGNHEKAL